MNSFKERFNLFFSEATPFETEDSFLIPYCNKALVNESIIDKIRQELLSSNHRLYISHVSEPKEIYYDYVNSVIVINAPIHFASTEYFYACLLHEFGHFLGSIHESSAVKTRRTLQGIPYFMGTKLQLESILIDELFASICSFRIAKDLKLDLDYNVFLDGLIRAFKGYWNFINLFTNHINIEYLVDSATEISDRILGIYNQQFSKTKI